jgi:hypothetical protein
VETLIHLLIQPSWPRVLSMWITCSVSVARGLSVRDRGWSMGISCGPMRDMLRPTHLGDADETQQPQQADERYGVDPLGLDANG